MKNNNKELRKLRKELATVRDIMIDTERQIGYLIIEGFSVEACRNKVKFHKKLQLERSELMKEIKLIEEGLKR